MCFGWNVRRLIFFWEKNFPIFIRNIWLWSSPTSFIINWHHWAQRKNPDDFMGRITRGERVINFTRRKYSFTRDTLFIKPKRFHIKTIRVTCSLSAYFTTLLRHRQRGEYNRGWLNKTSFEGTFGDGKLHRPHPVELPRRWNNFGIVTISKTMWKSWLKSDRLWCHLGPFKIIPNSKVAKMETLQRGRTSGIKLRVG